MNLFHDSHGRNKRGLALVAVAQQEHVMSRLSLQVDLVCHGKTEVFPDKDEADPYSVSGMLAHLSK